MRWEKKGLIFVPEGRWDWSRSHAQVPVVDVLSSDIWRIYYSTRDGENRSRIGVLDVRAGRPEEIMAVHPEPLLQLGELGTFDEAGMMPTSIVTVGQRKYLYYIGCTVPTSVPYDNSIGLAISDDGGLSFRRFATGPLFGRTWWEPYFTGTACVQIHNQRWHAWYLSCVGWQRTADKPEPRYHLKYAMSADGIDWDRDGTVAIDFAHPDEAAISNASVVRGSDRWRMWYCYRAMTSYRHDPDAGYRLGYAESSDGVSWHRHDDLAGLSVTHGAWDSGMVAYPNVLVHEGRYYLFYNGTGFGTTGFGYAVAEVG
jgi:hypothetical protein